MSILDGCFARSARQESALGHLSPAANSLQGFHDFHLPKATSMDAFLVPQPTESDADADSNATESTDSDATERDEGGDATENAETGAGAIPEPPTKKQCTRSAVVSEKQPGLTTQQADDFEDDLDETLPPVVTSMDASTTVADATGKKQMFTKSLAHRDDWLHRGIMLRDIDYYHYSRYVERVEMPRSGSAQSFQKQHGVY